MNVHQYSEISVNFQFLNWKRHGRCAILRECETKRGGAKTTVESIDYQKSRKLVSICYVAHSNAMSHFHFERTDKRKYTYKFSRWQTHNTIRTHTLTENNFTALSLASHFVAGQMQFCYGGNSNRKNEKQNSFYENVRKSLKYK